MTIKDLLETELYEEVTGPFTLTVKHTHKCTKVNGGWSHELTLTDDTGDILADMEMEVYSPLVRRDEIRILLCEIQPSTKDKKIVVKDWEKITCTADELPQREPLRQTVDPLGRSKVKCKLTEAWIKREGFPGNVERREILRIADWVMSLEDKYNE